MKAPGVILLSITMAGAGFAGGYFLARKKYFTLADREVESVKRAQADHDEYLLAAYGVDVTKTKPDWKKAAAMTNKTEAKAPEKTDEKEIESTNNGNERPVNYAGIVSQYGKPGEKVVVNKPKEIVFRLLTEVELRQEENNPKQLYWHPDGILADEDGNPISNFASVVGPTKVWLKQLQRDSFVYVKNDKTGEVFEIDQSENNWSELASKEQKKSLLDISGENDDD